MMRQGHSKRPEAKFRSTNLTRGKSVAKTLVKQISSTEPVGTLKNHGAEHGGIEESNNAQHRLAPGAGLAKNQTDAADYIVEMLVVLCNMAKDADLKFLNYLLEMAYEESLSHADKSNVIVKNQSL